MTIRQETDAERFLSDCKFKRRKRRTYMQKNIPARLNRLRQRMQDEKMDAYLVLSNDFHASEYVGEYFKCREYISGFSGSAGNVLVLPDEAGLWTDGRYFIQAEQELSGSGIALFRMEEEGVLPLEEYLAQKLPEHGCIGVDGRTMDVATYRKLMKAVQNKQATIRPDKDLVGDIWEERPEMSCAPAWNLDLCFAGKSRNEKIKEIRKKLKQEQAECTVISSLDDIAWLLNVRGNDVACTPVVLSYMFVSQEQVIWFVQEQAVDEKLLNELKADGIIQRNYHEIYNFLEEELKCQVIYIDPERVNMLIYEKAHGHERKRVILEGQNFTLLPKAIKNETEVANMRQAHRKDAVACIKFICWLKKNIGSAHMSERSVIKKLEEFRREQEHYLGASFPTIAGYAEHAALPHYSATEESDATLNKENYLLVDSGGHYLEGTTDITRTIALGDLTWEQKHHYTMVLKGNIRLAGAKFKYGCPGIALDYLAREELFKEGLDYNHGTGHGVGYLLSVHESPNSFRAKISSSKDECTALESGMITSDEPGIYLEGRYGIRIEDLLVCSQLEKNSYGQFLGFETLTLVPYERDAILVDELTDQEREQIDQYHEKVYDVISPYLNMEEKNWLKEATEKLAAI